MSETNQPIRPLPSPLVQELAKTALPKIMDGERGVSVRLPLPEGRPELWVTVSKHRLLFLDRGLKVALNEHHRYCHRCHAAIDKLRGQKTPGGLADLLQEVVNIVQNCNCTEANSPAAVVAPPEQTRSPLRINSPGNRVRVISTGGSVAPPPVAQETIRLTKSKGVSVVEDGSSAGADGAEESRAEKYTAPSIRFPLGPNSQVEVTIPRYVCEALVRHCRESNRHKREVGGMLVGHQGESQDEENGLKSYTNVVTDLIHFKPSDSSGAHLCLDANSWVHVSNIYEEKYMPRKKVRLGWYHTHPTQGIFFSPLDHDFHTNFNQPFQFAIVVDPRSMEAGLIYWKNYESRDTEGPIIFSLKRRNDASNSGGGTMSQGPPNVELPPITWLRFFFFGALTLAVFGYVAAQSPSFVVSPGHACLLALNALLGLRLLNANFFRPKVRIEDRGWAVLRKWMWVAFDRLALSYERSRGFVFTGMLVIIILLAVVLMFKALGVSPPAGMPPQSQMSSQPLLSANRSSTPQHQGAQRLYLNLVHSGRTLSLFPREGMPRITFRKAQNGQWEPLDTEAEKTFLRRVLMLDASVNEASDDVRRLQQHLYGGERAGTDTGTDGVWGAQIRNALLSELMQVQRESREWTLPWSEEPPHSVVVPRTPQVDSPRSERQSVRAAPRAARASHRLPRR
jgi:proteasome lid subunit RPN8/RPN11